MTPNRQIEKKSPFDGLKQASRSIDMAESELAWPLPQDGDVAVCLAPECLAMLFIK